MRILNKEIPVSLHLPLFLSDNIRCIEISSLIFASSSFLSCERSVKEFADFCTNSCLFHFRLLCVSHFVRKITPLSLREGLLPHFLTHQTCLFLFCEILQVFFNPLMDSQFSYTFCPHTLTAYASFSFYTTKIKILLLLTYFLSV